ncbi:MAG: hypothetical protein M1270_06760 [Gammaproteobacteria bacterium]|nr:hypothetical protein [Gammaproteobacteria bacterium]
MINNREQQLIQELKSICADGYSFYNMTARKAVSSELRMLFREMALVRAEIVNDINMRFSGLKSSEPSTTELALTMRAIYKLAHGTCSEIIDKDCLADLEAMEMRSLEILKIYVRRMNDRRISSYLAGHLANIQLSQDRLKRLKSERPLQRRVG